MKTASDIRAMLKEACEKAGTQKAWADEAGVSPQYVCDVLKGSRDPGISISWLFGYEPITLYRPVQGKEGEGQG